MAHLILPKQDLARIIRRRRETGADRHDEVWSGVYVMSPEADNVHQELVGLLTAVLLAAGQGNGIRVLPGANISNRRERWTRNYRCPDVAVFRPDNPAEDRGTHWLGGPDLAVEVVSHNDRSRRKLEFYAKVGTTEVLLVDRDPWRLELYRYNQGELDGKEVCEPGSASEVNVRTLGLSFRLLDSNPRPLIEVAAHDGRLWTV